MPLFSRSYDDTKLIAEISALSRQVAALKGERNALKDLDNLEQERAQLKKNLTDMKIEWDQEKEKWDREKRETEHLVGLQRKRQEFEVEAAKREVELTVREETLKADKERFQEQISYMEESWKQKFKSLEKLMGKVFDRMPETKQLISITPGNGNGNGED